MRLDRSPLTVYQRSFAAMVLMLMLVPDEMFQALLLKKVDAVVLGAPVLLYYAAHEGGGK